ncbi:MAG TPA: type II toxin-antitoxin system VapB family antitoxin [Actinophytocola sp.]|jgi:Arc/MetJ family transcription regulator|uniref:type II toxin-antitoxin system VapB family antitoxin n=1 Tax=Actinophytocola sp. TaxID=1872138 RepID=UPI002DFD651B|nr:type II toxin-antitoxin system VapB family antitoxin [Actinophytocola sp.]
MRTNIDIDDELLEKAMRLAGTKTKKSTVEQALEMMVRRYEQSQILELRGTVEWEGDLDEMRRSREFPR